MDLWRLYRAAHGPGLDGAGGLYAAGRWHRLGRRVVYFGASPAIVVLEKLAHVNPAALPDDLLLGHFDGEPGVESVTDPLDVSDTVACRTRGERFLEAARACALRVPSVVLPEEANYLVNALHPEAVGIRLVSERSFFFDERLVA
ncbi:MAG: RES family NAD+ phosphorylase [Steroidobacteraceae bacterium]